MNDQYDPTQFERPLHDYFGLSYANYLVLPRRLLCAMPVAWQQRLLTCLAEYNAAYAGIEQAAMYLVKAQDERGRFRRDPVPHYRDYGAPLQRRQSLSERSQQ